MMPPVSDAGWVSAETAEDTITRDAPSFRNLRRLGFEVAYRRPNYIWLRLPHEPGPTLPAASTEAGKIDPVPNAFARR